MRLNFHAIVSVLPALPAALSAQAPDVDYHQHLFSPAAAALVSGARNSPGIAARDLIALLDSAGIQRALVLSVAYTWGKASRAPVDSEYEHVKAENDWTAQQVAQYPDRLRAFCSFNPLKPYALEELARCSKNPQLHFGLKLHFGNSDVDLDNPGNVAQVKKIFEAANSFRMPIVVHMHASRDMHRRYGAAEARVFLDEVLPAAPDLPVQIAHLTGSGGYDAVTDSALGVFADAIARNDTRMKNVWFDAAVVVRPGMGADVLQQIAARIRQIGVQRVLYGSDAAASPLTYPKAGWTSFRRLPLSDAEFRVIADNSTPYMRDFTGATAQSTRTSAYLTTGIFIGAIEEGARIFTPVRLLPFDHPEALGHQFPTVLQLHRDEDRLLILLGHHAGLRLSATLQRYPAQPDTVWPYATFQSPPSAAFQSVLPTTRAAAEATVPGLRAVAYMDRFPLAFIVDTRGMSLAKRHMQQATAMGLDITRAQFIDALRDAARNVPATGPAVLIYQR